MLLTVAEARKDAQNYTPGSDAFAWIEATLQSALVSKQWMYLWLHGFSGPNPLHLACPLQALGYTCEF